MHPITNDVTTYLLTACAHAIAECDGNPAPFCVDKRLRDFSVPQALRDAVAQVMRDAAGQDAGHDPAIADEARWGKWHRAANIVLAQVRQAHPEFVGGDRFHAALMEVMGVSRETQHANLLAEKRAARRAAGPVMTPAERVYRNNLTYHAELDDLLAQRRAAEDAAMHRHDLASDLFLAMLDPRVSRDPAVLAIQARIDALLDR